MHRGNGIARFQFVIAGLDPAIHAAPPRMLTIDVAFSISAWTTGSSPVVTRKGAIGDEEKESIMKARRGTNRSFPGRMTLDEWLVLPYLRRLDLKRRAECERFDCHRLCARIQCKRHRTCCGADAQDCVRRLWHLTKPKPKTLWRELSRLSRLVELPKPETQLDAQPPWSSPPQQATPPAKRSRATQSGRAFRNSGRRSASRPVRAGKENSDAGLWEIIQTGQGGDEG